MRQVVLASLVALAAGLSGCVSSSPPAAGPGAATSPGPSATASGGPAPAASAGGPSAPGNPAGAAGDKEACARVNAKLTEWAQGFATASAGLVDAGSDVAKVDAVVRAIKANNSKYAADLRAEVAKTSDTQVKTVTNGLAGALEKSSTELDAAKIAKDPGALAAVFEQPAYVAAADAYEKVCPS
ncbi:MAG TPA: hypothetical protein VF062_16905 [Candidatus Limnocylindrales bacterium]